MITVGILFCDRDLDYLKDFLNTIPNKIFIPYEIILLDNRNDNTSDISFLNDYTVLNKGKGNLYQLVGRKKIIEKAKGDYIWFVDPDDTLFEIYEDDFAPLLELNYDFYIFSFLYKSLKGDFWYEQREKLITDDILTFEANDSSCSLWNKWIKTDVLKQVIKYIPNTAKVSASEDLIYVLGSLKFGKSQLQSKKYVYTFNVDNSCSGLDDYSKEYEKFERCFFGLDEANEIIKNILTEEELNKLCINLERHDCTFFFKKILLTDNVKVKQKMFNLAKNYFSKDIVKKTWYGLLNSQKMTEKQYEDFNKILKSEYGEDIDVNETITHFIYDDGKEETITEKEKINPLHII